MSKFIYNGDLLLKGYGVDLYKSRNLFNLGRTPFDAVSYNHVIISDNPMDALVLQMHLKDYVIVAIQDIKTGYVNILTDLIKVLYVAHKIHPIESVSVDVQAHTAAQFIKVGLDTLNIKNEPIARPTEGWGDYFVSRYPIKFDSVLELVFYESLPAHIKALIKPQVMIGKYRVDFLLWDVIIELDGYAYHSKKKQRQHDTTRDRYLTTAGYRILRFTGTDVVHNLLRVKNEVIRIQ